MTFSRTSVGMGSSMQVFGGDHASSCQTSLVMYSLRPVNIYPLDDEFVRGLASAVAVHTSSNLVLKLSDNLSAVSDGGVGDISLTFFRMDNTDLHILPGFPASLTMQLFP